MKRAILLIATLCGLCAALYAADIPAFGKFRLLDTGAAVSYIAGTGTNSVLDVDYDGDLPFKLTEVTATVNSAAVTTKVYRVWNYTRQQTFTEVVTNFFDQVETNTYHEGFATVLQTNKVYDSTVADPFLQGYFLPGDLMVIDLDGNTGAVVRVLGVTE